MKTVQEFIPLVKDNAEARGIMPFAESIYEQEINEAIFTINECRRFTPTKEVLYPEKYESLIVPLVISSLAKMGAEGQTSHSENGIVRGYGNDGKYPTSLLRAIKPLIK